MSSRNSFPGGLRAQLLIALTVLFTSAAALAAIVVENVLTRRLLEVRSDHLESVARVLPSFGDGQVDELLNAGVADVIVTDDTTRGSSTVGEKIATVPAGESRLVTAEGVRYLAVAVEAEGTRVWLASSTRDVADQVAKARGILVLFLVLGGVFILATAYGLFSLIVIRPIRAIGIATERAAQGDLASPISIVPRNELGRVASSFNEMLARLDESRRELELKIEELQSANRELAETRDSLVRSEKLASVGQLAAGIAHEIGNPLAALSGYNELLRDGTLEEDAAEDLLRRSSEQLERIRQVIRNLLDFSRDDEDAVPQPTDVSDCVEETLNLVRALPTARNVEFETGDLDGPAAWGRPSQLVQVFVNLSMNAVDVLQPEGGTVRFDRTDTDGFVEIGVEDDGPGIPAEHTSRIFDPFFTTKEPGAGTGLGLAISARIVQAFGGDIRLERGGEGARLVVRLPRAEGAESDASREES